MVVSNAGHSAVKVTEQTRLVSKVENKFGTYMKYCDRVASNFVVNENHPLRNYTGIFYGVLSGINFSICTLCVKLLANVSSNHLAIVRHLFTASFAMPLAVYCGESFMFDLKDSGLVFGRAICDTAGVILMFSTIQRVSIEESTVIIFSSPALIAVLGRIFLKEKCGVTLVISIFLIIMGVCLVVKLPWHIVTKNLWTSSEIEGVIYGVCSIFTVSSFYIFSSLLRKVKVEIILWHSSWMSVVFTLAITTIMGDDFKIEKLEAYDFRVMLLMGVVSFLGQFFLIKALKVENSGPVSIARSASDILCAFAFDFAFFAAEVDAFNISGAVLVLLGGVAINISKYLGSLPDDSSMKKKFKLLST